MNLFLSYCHKDHIVADRVDSNLMSVGINVIRDIRDFSTYASLKQLMAQSVDDSDKMVLIVSDSYLKSKNCMFEILEVMRARDYGKQVIPIILSDAEKIFSPKDRIEYIHYWTRMEQVLKDELEKIDWQNHTGIVNDLSIYSEIKNSIGDFCSTITDLLSVSIKDLEKSNFREVLEFIGIEITEPATKVLQIINNKDVEEREIEIEAFLEKYGKTKYADFLKGVVAVERKLFNKAKSNYLECINKDSNFDQARISLANLYMMVFRDYEAAEKEYLRAINNNPNIRAYNNIGILYHYYLDDPVQAKAYYEKAISMDPFYRHPFYNLGNLHRVVTKNFQEAEKCYLKAIDLDENYGCAHNGMGILNMAVKADMNSAKDCFEKALKIDPTRLEYMLNMAEYYRKTEQEKERARFYYEYALLVYPKNRYLISRYLDYAKAFYPKDYQSLSDRYKAELSTSPEEDSSELDKEEVVFLTGEPVIDQLESAHQRIIDYNNIR